MPVLNFSANTAALHTLVPEPPTGKRNEILGLVLTSAGTVQVTLDLGNGAVMTIEMTAGNPVVLPPTRAWELLGEAASQCSLTLGGAVRVSGMVVYAVV